MRIRLRSSLVGASIAAAMVVVGLATADAGVASADTACAVMTLEADSSGTLVLSPQSVTVDNGGCVQFSNQTIFAARFSVGSYNRTVPAFSQTSGAGNYTATPAGATQTVVAREAAGNASGTIVIRSAPTHSPSPAPRRTSSRPAPSQQPSSAPPRTTQTQPSPATSSAKAKKKSKPTPRPARSTPAPTSSSFLAGQPTASPSSPPVAAIGGPLQPPSDRGTGLPGALAALAIVATAGALLRVLLAEPVDRPHSVGARP